MTEAERHWRERIDAARRLIEARLDEDIPLEELARAAHYSMFHFHRLFRGVTGETVRAHVRRLRLERAAYRLTHNADDILPIALDAGYDSHEAFTRAFASRFGVAPSIFREERRSVQTQRADRANAGEDHMDVRIERRDPVHIAAVRHVGPYNEVGDAWKTLMKWGWTKMMFGKTETFGLCFDDPDVTPAERIRYEACMVVKPDTKVKGDIIIRELPGGAFAVAVHEGPFDTISATYATLCAQVVSTAIDGTSWKLGDPPSREVYLMDPRKTVPADMRTEIWMPVSAPGVAQPAM